MTRFPTHTLVAQIGLGTDPTGGFLVILFIGALAVIGLLIATISGINFIRSGASRYKNLWFCFAGLVLASPALWFTFVLFAQDLIPCTKSWDFSSSRSIAQLEEDRDEESYYYQGNIHSSVKLAANKQWSGNAYLVMFRAKSGKITEIHWQSRRADTRRIYEQTQRILKELAMADVADKELDAWYTEVRRGEPASFSAVARSETDANIEVLVRSVGQERAAEPSWTVHVNVRWNEGAETKP